MSFIKVSCARNIRIISHFDFNIRLNSIYNTCNNNSRYDVENNNDNYNNNDTYNDDDNDE